jgi:DNA processing protein
MTACDDCLRRSALLGLIAHYIGNSLSEHRRLPALLSLDDHSLIEAVCGKSRTNVKRAYSEFEPIQAHRKAERAGLSTVCRHQSDTFPATLLEAPDAPPMLYLCGDRDRLARLASDPAVAVVGSRRASAYGLEVAHALGRDLAAAGVTVVSGMAFGIDSAAHEGALAGDGLTVAVLGGGADVPYPRSKLGLYKRIASQGLALSEMPPGTEPLRWCFPARNRIMAALCAMTIVVEGAGSSGSLITAGFAADLGREVGAVPGPVTSRVSAGANALLADGAYVVRSAGDVLDALFGPGAAEARRIETSAQPALDGPLRALLESIEQGKGSADAIASQPADVPEILAGLTELELMGLIRRGAGGSYIRCA